VAATHTMHRLIYHPRYAGYDLGPEHPFSPVRQAMVVDLLAELGVAAPVVEPEELPVEALLGVHDESYLTAVEAASRGEDSPAAASYGLGTTDNPIVPGMAAAARLICGGTVLGARLIAEGQATRVFQLGGGFHHARRAMASGFCLYNDLALAIHELSHNGRRVAYLDLDVHHGDGVQEIFYADEQVMTLSLHESGEYLYPGSGWVHELGQGMGRGLKLNLPLEPFTEGASYLESLRAALEPALEWFRPHYLVAQCGADAHYLDPLADLMLTTRDFERVFRTVLGLADRFCDGRILVTAGGGYSLDATPRVWTLLALLVLGQDLPETLPEGWRQHWRGRLGGTAPATLHDPNPSYEAIPRRGEIERHNRSLVQRLLDAVAPLWW